MKQLPQLQNVSFICGDYKQIDVDSAVVYCDPPYEDTKKYASVSSFNYNEFWDWCRKQNENNILFVSGYDAPDDFKCIWSKDVIVNFDSNRNENSNKNRTEKLFILDKSEGDK